MTFMPLNEKRQSQTKFLNPFRLLQIEPSSSSSSKQRRQSQNFQTLLNPSSSSFNFRLSLNHPLLHQPTNKTKPSSSSSSPNIPFFINQIFTISSSNSRPSSALAAIATIIFENEMEDQDHNGYLLFKKEQANKLKKEGIKVTSLDGHNEEMSTVWKSLSEEEQKSYVSRVKVAKPEKTKINKKAAFKTHFSLGQFTPLMAYINQKELNERVQSMKIWAVIT